MTRTGVNMLLIGLLFVGLGGALYLLVPRKRRHAVCTLTSRVRSPEERSAIALQRQGFPFYWEVSMDLQVLNKLCLTICIVCIVVGTVLSISMIWVT